jgi:hypothetical protein
MIMMKRTLVTGIFAALISTILFFSCSKDSSSSNNGTAHLSMRLTDGPGVYDHIYLDIQQVVVTMSGSSAVTINVIHPGVYDLLEFKNGMDTLLAEAEIPAGTVEQMRLVLGTNNSIVVDGISYPLTTPSAQESGLKLNFNTTFVANGSYNLWIDFDASKSILQTGNGSYKLKPVIRAYSALTDGRIKGYVLPLAAFTTVYAINGIDSFTAIPDALTGYYRISGLPAASYNVVFDAALATPYQDTTVMNVNVMYGVETNLGTITLHP